MKPFSVAIADAHKTKTAIGHFNVGTLEMLRAVVAGAEDAGLPVIVGASEGERDAFGVANLVALVEEMRKTASVSIYLNADHTYSVERVKEAIDAGFDSVIFDGAGAKLSLEENIAKTKECVDYARASGRAVLVEGELGFIGTGSQLLDEIPAGAAITEEMMTKPDDAARYAKEAGIDLLAPAVGNIHGMLKNAKDPALSIPRVRDIREAASVPLVLHGGSGVSDEDFLASIDAGVVIVHISTELRIAYREGLEDALKEHPEEAAPYKYMKNAGEAVRRDVAARLKLFARARG